MFKLSLPIHCNNCGFEGRITSVRRYTDCPECGSRNHYILKNPKFDYTNQCNACKLRSKFGCIIEQKEFRTKNRCNCFTSCCKTIFTFSSGKTKEKYYWHMEFKKREKK